MIVLSYASAAELLQRGLEPGNPASQPRLGAAIRRAFPASDAKYRGLIARRFIEAYGVPEDEAIKAVSLGYSSPSAAMKARVIRRRPYRGFKGERS
jgi:hypothetical protein